METEYGVLYVGDSLEFFIVAIMVELSLAVVNNGWVAYLDKRSWRNNDAILSVGVEGTISRWTSYLCQITKATSMRIIPIEHALPAKSHNSFSQYPF